jgi:hypothetical protein
MSSPDVPPVTAPIPTGITVKKTLTNHIAFNSIVAKIVSILKGIDNYEQLKNHPEIINMTCDLIEYYVPNNTFNFDKKAMAVQILDVVFSLTIDEKATVATQIDFLYNNNMIQPTPFWKIAYSYIKSFFSVRSP